jgi:WD40 repeat protein
MHENVFMNVTIFFTMNILIFFLSIYSGAGDKILKRWPLPMGAEGLTKLVVSHNVRGHDKDINTLAVSPNDSMAASGSQDKTIRLWRTSDLGPIATLSGHKRGVWKVRLLMYILHISA